MRDQTRLDPERHGRLKELFLRAIEIEGGARGRFVDAECRDDHELHEELRSLLEYHRRSDLGGSTEGEG